jgi:hypothetical protein
MPTPKEYLFKKGKNIFEDQADMSRFLIETDKSPFYGKNLDSVRTFVNQVVLGKRPFSDNIRDAIFLGVDMKVKGDRKEKELVKQEVEKVFKNAFENQKKKKDKGKKEKEDLIDIILKGQNLESPGYSKLEGNWKCFYDKEGCFREAIENNKEAFLNIIEFQFKGNTFKYENKTDQDKGIGYVQLLGVNFIMQLYGEKKKRSNIIMDCGQSIEVYQEEHVKYSVGIFTYLNDIGCVKAAKCAMLHYTEAHSDNLIEVDSNLGKLKVSLNEDHDWKNRLISFFKKDSNIVVDIGEFLRDT